ncbi:MAG: response regulator [Gammaproteobacteria bacterium]|nr:response regulator [Gammaproteobacteria bacterium]
MSNIEDKKIILIVDDTKANIDVLSGVLRPTYKTKIALNGEKALKLAATEPKPDIILLDIMMPDMDGYEVCRHLKIDAGTTDIPVIFLTAKDQEKAKKKGLDLGAVDFISKPINPNILLERVEFYLQQTG